MPAIIAPCCGGPLKFSGESCRLECAACGNNYEPEALEMMASEESGDEITFANDAKRFDIFGNKTRAGVIAFQQAKGLAADGIVGSLTRAALLAA